MRHQVIIEKDATKSVGSGAENTDTVTVGITSTLIVAANASRRHLFIQNKHDEVLYVNVSGDTATTDDFEIAPKDSREFAVAYQAQINGTFVTAPGPVYFEEA